MPDERATVVFGGDSGSRQKAEQGTPCLVVYYGQDLGRRYPLEKAAFVIGRSATAAIQIDQDSVSRDHAQILVHGAVHQITDLGSTNGTWVNDTRVESVELRDGDLVRIGQTVFKYLTGANIEAKYHEQIYHLTTTDGLTDAANKRSFLETLEREVRRANRYNRRFSLAMFDIDLFKRVNDTWGHLAGDAVLRDLSRLVATQIRKVDTLARFGGEEFTLILPEIDRDGALAVCEKLRQLVNAHTFHYNDAVIPISVSFGIATVDRCGTPGGTPPIEPASVIAQADAKLYEAKQAGRNSVRA